MAKKLTTSISLLSYILVSTVIFCVTFLSFIISGAYFSANKVVSGTITLGQLDFRILNNLSQIITSEPQLFMPDEVINNAVTILNARDDAGVNTSGLTDLYLRIKPILEINSVSSLQFLHVELNNPTVWVQGSDGFLYYKNKLLVGDRIIFNDYFTLSYLIDNQYQNLPVYLGLRVDTVQSEGKAYESEWFTAPTEWITIINN
ncbi:MAG: hypothetical protein CVV59_00830 [Tenericutes bacterium HGW-Tenericutes-4]|jgi:hypothetical protein|nr:MAG: hypothetical protein CVV59_00830 [Tenericutes bacterium HGW-Tenericutes-4]